MSFGVASRQHHRGAAMPATMTKREFLSTSSRALAALGLLGVSAGCSGPRRARTASPPG
jgi:hypothetical protein